MSGLICQICNINQALGVGCSRLGPVSFAMCRACIQNNAEPESMVKAILLTCKGWENVQPEVAATVTVFKGRRYVLASSVVPNPTEEEIKEYERG